MTLDDFNSVDSRGSIEVSPVLKRTLVEYADIIARYTMSELFQKFKDGGDEVTQRLDQLSMLLGDLIEQELARPEIQQTLNLIVEWQKSLYSALGRDELATEKRLRVTAYTIVANVDTALKDVLFQRTGVYSGSFEQMIDSGLSDQALTSNVFKHMYTDLLLKRYPDYKDFVAEFIQSNEKHAMVLGYGLKDKTYNVPKDFGDVVVEVFCKSARGIIFGES